MTVGGDEKWHMLIRARALETSWEAVEIMLRRRNTQVAPSVLITAVMKRIC